MKIFTIFSDSSYLLFTDFSIVRVDHSPQNVQRWPASWIGFLRFSRLLKIFHVLRLRQALQSSAQPHDAAVALNLSEVSYHIARLVVSIIVFLLVAAGTVYAVTLFQTDAFMTPFGHVVTWFDCFYFTIMTVSTVGYGDIAPVTVPAKVLTSAIVLLGFSLIPVQAVALVSVLLRRPQYLGELSLPFGSKHICVCGIVDYELLFRVLTEVFHSTHAPQAVGVNIKVVVLSPNKPSQTVEILLLLSQFVRKVEFFVGSSKSHIDLARIHADESLAIYIVSDASTSSLKEEEDSVFLSAISISRFLDLKEIEHEQKVEKDDILRNKRKVDFCSKIYYYFTNGCILKDRDISRNNNNYNNYNNNNNIGYERRENSLGKGLENIRIPSVKYNNGGEHSSSITGHEEHSAASPSRGMTRGISRDTLSREEDFRQRKREWERRRERPRTIVKLSSTASNRSVLVASGIDVILSLQVSSS